MTDTFDAIVAGGGVVGSSTAFHLVALGCRRVLLVDRGPICSGGTAKSCAIIRSHYSVPTNTQLTVKSIDIFRDFAAYVGDADTASGFVNSGYLIVAPPGPVAEALRANLAMQAGVGAETHEIGREEARELHPRLNLDDIGAVGYEPRSGYADPYLTTTGFVNAARKRGLEVRPHCRVTGLLVTGGRVRGVRTEAGDFEAQMTVCAIGPWSRELASWLGTKLPLETSRHIVLTLKEAQSYGPRLPVMKDLATANKMYFRPATGGVVLVGTGDHGDPLDDPDLIDENVPTDFVAHQAGQIARRMPSFAQAGLVRTWTGVYDITPDWNPVLGPVPGLDGIRIAYGFSGHGFKMAPMVGKILAQSALDQVCDVAIEPYRLDRFAAGKLLTGAYGIGSIS